MLMLKDTFKALGAKEPKKRIEGSRTLGQGGVNHPQIITKLQTLAEQDPDQDVRLAAAQSLNQLGVATSINTPAGLHTQNAQPSNELTQILESIQKQNQILLELRDLLAKTSYKPVNPPDKFRATLIDIDMPILRMANLMVRWFIASIPAGLTIIILLMVLSSCLGSFGLLNSFSR